MTDLLVSVYPPILGSGHGLRTYGIARALAAGGGLQMLYVPFREAGPDRAFQMIEGLEFHEAVNSRGVARGLAYVRARLRGLPGGFARAVAPELTGHARRLAPPDGRVVADGLPAAAALLKFARAHPVIYNAHNLESAFRGELGGSAFQNRRLSSFERQVLSHMAESWMVSDGEVTAARALCPGARIRYVPNVVDVTQIRPVAPAAGARRAVFVASFSYAPNRLALRFLLDDVLPLVWQKLPDARLTVVGKGSHSLVPNDSRVNALGFVEDLGPVYRDASCAVVPLLHGGGTPLKLIEALAYGLPVVTTRRSTIGLDVRDGEHCLIADEPAQFAGAMVRALCGEAAGCGVRGRALVKERYSIEALTTLLRVSG